MTTTTIGPFTVTHENGVLQSALKVKKEVFYTESDFLREFSLVAATEIERLRANKGDAMNEIQSAINGKLINLINERDQLKSELAASKEGIERLRMAAIAHSSDLWEAGRLCAQSDGEYPLAAVQRAVAELAASKDEIERLRVEANEAHIAKRLAMATHRCKVCDAKWIFWPEHNQWSLASQKCGKCCDAVAMGDQIEPIGLTAEVDEYDALTEKLGGLLRDIANVLRGPPGELSSWGFTGLDELGAEILDQRDHLKSELAASIAAQEKMRRVGNLMSNVCFNLAQHTSTKKELAATMDGLRREWDLVRLAASQTHAGNGEVGK